MYARSILLGLLLGACTKDPSPLSKPEPGSSASVPVQMKVGAAPTAPPSGDDLSGTVVETMSSGGYTYVKLDRGVWLAGPETKLAVGAKIGKTSGTPMNGFHSDTLNRTFDQIYFVNALPVASGAAMPNPHGVVAATAPVDKVEPAPGGKTVAEIYAGKADLANKPVVVRGKVVKVNNGILGHNWFHLQDGTGAAGTNDLVVTTDALVNKDDVVSIRGTLALDRDFGAGYKYPVLLQDATLVTK